MLVDKHKNIECSIVDSTKVNEDVYVLTLEAPINECFKFQPGQYLYVQISEDFARPYSIASAPCDGRMLQLHIKDIPGNQFATQVLNKLETGSKITIQMPAGECTISRSSGIRPLLFIAGGTGYAPCYSMIKYLIDSNDPRSISLFWGTNSAKEFYLQDELEQWMNQITNFNFIPVIANQDSNWSGQTGMVYDVVINNINKLSDYDIYLSGSGAMVDYIYNQLRETDVPSNQIFSDMLDLKQK